MTPSEIRGLRTSFTRDEYVSPEVFDLDMEHVYGSNWCFAGLAQDLGHVGDRLVVEVGTESVLVVRNRNGELRAYYNVCQHRGSQLCDESGSGYGAAITCPYHSWSYSLDGALVSAIHHDKDDFDRECISLAPVRVDEWQGCIFVSLDADGPSLLDHLGGLYSQPRELERFDIGSLVRAHHTVDEAACNWKVLVENYSECLHCSVVHPEFCDVVPVYKTGRTIDPDRDDWAATLAPGATAVSFDRTSALPMIPGMDEPLVFGAFVYPNMLIDVMPTCIALTRYVPRTATTTTVHTDYLFPASVVADPNADLSPTLSFNELVNTQDIAVSERVQRGVASKSFVRSYHTSMEKYAQQFVKRYRADAR